MRMLYDIRDLESEITFEEAEATLTFKHDDFTQKWNEFKNNFQEGDKLYKFSTSDWTWQQLMGRAGYLILRKHEVVSYIVTLLN